MRSTDSNTATRPWVPQAVGKLQQRRLADFQACGYERSPMQRSMTSNTPPVARPVVAVFDFDGTLTRRDTSLPFVVFVLGRVKTCLTIVRLVPMFGLDLVTAFWDERLKSQAGQRESLGGVVGKWEANVHERLLRHCFAGMTADRLRDLGERFMAIEGASLIKQAGLRRLAWHKSQGHRCILISASIDVYLDAWATDAGFDDVLGTQLELDYKGVFTGRFAMEPCWGRAKVRRLESHLGSLADYTVFAYGDSRGDKDLLAAADHGFLVRGEFEFTK